MKLEKLLDMCPKIKVDCYENNKPIFFKSEEQLNKEVKLVRAANKNRLQVYI